jgi:hypothetical protein
MTTTTALQLGFSVALKAQVIDENVIQNILAMTGKGSHVRIMEARATYNPAPDVYHLDTIDQTIDALDAAGLPVVFPLFGAAPNVGLTTPGTGVCHGKELVIPEEDGKLAAFLAARYKGKNVSYEPLNEGAGDGRPDCILQYTSDPNGAVAVMRAVYEAVKGVDHSIHVGGPALLRLGQGVPFIEEWVTNLFEVGADKYMDSLAIHDYLGHDPAQTSPTLREIWQAIQGVCKKYKSPLRLKITEYGFSRGKLTPQQQSDYTMAVIKEAQSSGGFIDGLYYWTPAPHDSQSPYESSPPHQINYPLYAAFQSVR